jgi:hypothetical protein
MSLTGWRELVFIRSFNYPNTGHSRYAPGISRYTVCGDNSGEYAIGKIFEIL